MLVSSSHPCWSLFPLAALLRMGSVSRGDHMSALGLIYLRDRLLEEKTICSPTNDCLTRAPRSSLLSTPTCKDYRPQICAESWLVDGSLWWRPMSQRWVWVNTVKSNTVAFPRVVPSAEVLARCRCWSWKKKGKEDNYRAKIVSVAGCSFSLTLLPDHVPSGNRSSRAKSERGTRSNARLPLT